MQTLPPRELPESGPPLAKTAGFSLHAGVAAEAHQRDTLERLCRYIARPAVCLDRLSLTPFGSIRYGLKNPWRDGTTDLLFEPLDFLARLASLVPAPRAPLTRYHGVFAPHSRLRAQVTPAGRGSRPTSPAAPSPAERHRAMTWAQRLKRVFLLDLAACTRCGGAMRILSCIEDPDTIQRILTHRKKHCGSPADLRTPAHRPRAPPQRDRFDTA